jgi:hypothetical protein
MPLFLLMFSAFIRSHPFSSVGARTLARVRPLLRRTISGKFHSDLCLGGMARSGPGASRCAGSRERVVRLINRMARVDRPPSDGVDLMRIAALLGSVMAGSAEALEVAHAERRPITSVRDDVVHHAREHREPFRGAHTAHGLGLQLMGSALLPAAGTIPSAPMPFRWTRITSPPRAGSAHRHLLQCHRGPPRPPQRKHRDTPER